MLASDVHSHLMPEIDDGSRTRAETLIMAKGLARLGVKRLHLTPHQFRFGNDLTPTEVRDRAGEVEGWFEEEGIALEIHAAAEYLYGERFLDALEDGEELLTWSLPGEVGGESRILVETPLRQPVIGVSRVPAMLAGRGIRPVLAHPERVVSVQQDLGRLDRWVEAGWELQLDLLSLVGSYGRNAKQLARSLLKEGRYRVAGSDLHRPVQLRDLEKAHDVFRRLAPEGAA